MLASFFIPALAFLVAGVVAAVVNLAIGPGWARWLSLHLILLGGVSQLVLGASQFFAAAFLATDPPPRRLIASQLLTWNTGALLIAVGRPTGVDVLVSTGGLLILAGLVLFISGLLNMRRRSIQSNHWAVRWYATAAVLLAAGAVIGVVLAEGQTGGSYAGLLAAHFALNLLGWLGTAIVGTLHTFFPSLTGTRLPFPRLEGVTFLAWVGGVAALSVGFAFDSTPVALLGWLSLALAAGLLFANLAECIHRKHAEAGLPVLLVGLGQLFLLAGACLGLVSTADGGTLSPVVGETGDAMSTLVLAGWIGLTVAGSLVHLLGLLARVRSGFAVGMPARSPVRDRLVTAGAAAGLTALAVSAAVSSDVLGTLARLLILLAAAPVAAILARSAFKVVRPGSGGPGPGMSPPAVR